MIEVYCILIGIVFPFIEFYRIIVVKTFPFSVLFSFYDFRFKLTTFDSVFFIARRGVRILFTSSISA